MSHGHVLVYEPNYPYAQAISKEIRETSENDDYWERYAKTSVKAPEAFSGAIGDWTPWKIGTRSIFGLIGLTRILDDREHALRHPVKNATVYHSLCQAVVKGTASSTFSRAIFVNDCNAAWKQLMDRHEGACSESQRPKESGHC